MSKRSVVLIILDGWGIGKEHESNPIHTAHPPVFEYLKKNYPSGSLQASGISVGLPWGEEGNSEVGHLNMGAGKIVYQAYPKITMAIQNGAFFKNENIKNAFEHAKEHKSTIHIAGLLTEANTHASLTHLEALISFAKKEDVRFYLHLFTDGVDSPPQSAINLLKLIPQEYIGTIGGRFYGMDKDKHWDRTQKAINALLGNTPIIENIENHLRETFAKQMTEEYLSPVKIKGYEGIKDNDSLIFFNFREDGMRQTVAPFASAPFQYFPFVLPKNLFTVTMVPYDDTFNLPVAFKSEIVENPLAKILADNGKIQFRIAESYKYAHITYFFNGLTEKAFKNEYRVIIPSRPDLHPEEHPEMRAREITARLSDAVRDKSFDFILANFANPDRIGHTGNYKAAIEVVRVIDQEIKSILDACRENGAYLVITSDHGNIEQMSNPLTSRPETQHDPSPVPIYLVGPQWQKERQEEDVKRREKETIGILADIAPTILELMDLPKPKEITGQSLLKSLIS